MRRGKIGYLEAVSIGIGGMVGGGIFAVLGLTIELAKGAAPVAFFLAGLIALITAYSYVKLSLRYPSEGGTIEFIVQAFGNNTFSAVVNNLLLTSYIIMLALYAYAFGSYGSALFADKTVPWLQKSLAALVIFSFAFVNLMGATTTGRAEDIMVLIKVLILLCFAGIGFFTINWQHVAPQNWEAFPKIAVGGLIIFLAYEGFELIANTAGDVDNPEKTLPRAFYTAVIFVIFLYVLVSLVAIGNLSFAEAAKAKDYALAEAAKPFLGNAGFILIGLAALLSTASAINATIYGSGRTSYLVAKLGELPEKFEERVKHGNEGMIIISLLGLIFAISFNLDNISVAGSLGFLIVFALVNLGNFLLYKETKGNRIVSFTGFLLASLAAVVLVGYSLVKSPQSLITSGLVIILVIFFTFAYQIYKEEKPIIAEFIDKRLEINEKERS